MPTPEQMTVIEKKQANLIDVDTSEAHREAERYADISDDIASKKALLVQQSEKVVQIMKKSGQRTLSYTDQYGYKHQFTVVDTQEKLHHSKRQEA